MFKFFKNNDSKDHSKSDDELLSKTTSLLIHAAKIDENYTDKEKEIIKKTLIELGIEESKVDQRNTTFAGQFVDMEHLKTKGFACET